jgi:hypothetical protein
MTGNILNDVYNGINVYDQNMSTPYSQSDYLNSGYDVSVEINISMPFPLPVPEGVDDWRYLDPGVAICDTPPCDSTLLLESLGYGKTHEYTIYLIGGHEVQTSWSFDDETVCCFWGCGAGRCAYYSVGSMWMEDPDGVLVPGTSVNQSTVSTPLKLRFNYSVPEGASGNYTIKFKNNNSQRTIPNILCACDTTENRPAYSAPFVAGDDPNYTWVRIGKLIDGQVYSSYQDYRITATASRNGEDIVSITMYVRHTPGPLGSWLEQTVEIPGWQAIYY